MPFLWGHWYPCYGLLVTSPLGFKALCTLGGGAHVTCSIEFFTVYTKLPEIALLESKDLTTAKKVNSSCARPDAKDYYWFKSPMPSQMS